jgi:hypothetical protein
MSSSRPLLDAISLVGPLLSCTYEALACTNVLVLQRGVLTQLLALRTMVSDWTNDTESRTDYKDYKRREVRAITCLATVYTSLMIVMPGSLGMLLIMH